MEKIKYFIKNEAVLCVASLLAVISMFVIHPSKAYLAYIDFKVLSLLFALMLVVSGFQKEGVFERIMYLMSGFVKNSRQLYLILVLSNFVFSMVITNDVSLLTLVPFAIMVLNRIGQKKLLPLTIVMQTIAANLGSMCTPIGNPQNLYLYTVSSMKISEFFWILLPYTLVSLILLLLTALLVPKEKIEMPDVAAGRKRKVSGKKIGCYCILFGLCLLTILRILPYWRMLLAVMVTIALIQPVLFKRADYLLLLTFVAFFIFVGNVREMNMAGEILQRYVRGREIWVSIAASQVISNVPAAVLLSGFTDDYRGLLIGTNLGGLGTLIASMASLISYKLYARTSDCDTGKYIRLFTVMNVGCLIILCMVNVMLGMIQ